MTILCDSPVLIPNPNFGKHPKAGSPMALKDCTSTYIPVPCGHCDSCIANKQMQLVQRVQMESLCNHVFFCTLTYNNEMLPTLVTSADREIRYTDYKDLQNMFKRLRNDNAFGVPFRYFAVTERGSKKARPHAHILFFVRKGSNDSFSDIMHLERILYDNVLKYWSRNIGSNRKPIYKPCCDYIRKFIRGKLKSSYDLHYVFPSIDDPSGNNVAFYCLKYMLKFSNHDVKLQQALRLNYSDEEYRDTWNLVKSRHIYSKGFGLGVDEFSRRGLGSPDDRIIKYLRECVTLTKKDKDSKYPCFYNPVSGNSFPLARYYKNRGDVYKMEDALHFYFKDFTDDIDSPINLLPEDFRDLLQKSDILKMEHHSDFIHSVADELCDADCFDELFE